MEDTWVTVRAGSPGAVLVQRAALEAAGIPTFVPDETMKAWDPFITGANALDSSLQVPASRLEEARELLGEPGPPHEPTGPLDEARRLATRMAFASMMILTAPYALILAPRYFALVRRAGERPPNHRTALLGLVLACGVLIASLLLQFFDGEPKPG